MRIDARFLGWGVFFILLGAVPLAVQANLVDRSVVARAWQLWPLLIIGAGAGLLLRHTSFHFVGGMISAATVGLMLGGLLAVGTDFSSFARSCGGDAKPFTAQQGALSGSGQVDLEFNCGDLAIGTAPGSNWTVNGTTEDGQPPRVDAGASRLAVKSRDTSIGFFGFGGRQAWNVTLPQDPGIDVDLTLNAAAGTLGFGGAHLGSLEITGNAGSSIVDLSAVAAIRSVKVTFNAGSAKLSLPNASLTGEFQVNAGSVAFCVPEGVGLRLTSGDNITGSNNFAEQGLVKSGNVWQNAAYGTATTRMDLTTNANAGSLALNPKDGCR